MIVQVKAVVEQCLEVSCAETAVYAVMASPPLESEASHESVATALPAMPVGVPGASGRVAGVTADDWLEAGLVPVALMALTVKL